MSRRNDSSKLNTRTMPKVQPGSSNNTEMNRRAAEGSIPEGPVKNQDKRSRG